MSRDIYAQQLARQNEGLPCVHCGSHSGHFVTCAVLITKVKGSSEVLGTERNAPVLALNSDDKKWLKGLLISL